MDPSAVAAAASSSAGRSAAAASTDTDALNHKLFFQEGLLHNPRNVDRLQVTVHRANNVELDAIQWSAPRVRVMLGGATRRSPVGKALEGAEHRPIVFDWHTEFRYTGTETFLTFEVYSAVSVLQSSLLGSCYVPLEEVFRARLFRKALPLLREGHARPREGPDAPSELLLSVKCREEGEPGLGLGGGGGGARALAQAARSRAEELRSSCTQLRVTVRELHLKQLTGGAEVCKLRPYTSVAVGVQSKRTMPALNLTERDAEEFIFVDRQQHRQCDAFGLLRGLGQRYEAPPLSGPRGSKAVPAYRKRLDANGDLHVVYRDVRVTFWHIQQNNIDVDIFDSTACSTDTHLATASLELMDLFQRPFQGAAAAAAAAARGPAKVRERLPLAPISLHGDEVAVEGDTSIGHLELDVEILQDPFALPSPLEGLLRRLATLHGLCVEQHRASLSAVADVVTRQASELADVGRLPEAVRAALARLIASTAMAQTRRVVEHEDDSGALLRTRLSETVALLVQALALPSSLQQELHLAAQAATGVPSGPEGAEAAPPPPLDALSPSGQRPCSPVGTYLQSCATSGLDRLFPFAALAAHLLRRQLHGAALRSALLCSAEEVAGHDQDGRCFVELVERYLIQEDVGALAPESTSDDFGSCQPAAAMVSQARDLFDEETSCTGEEREQLERRRSAGKFLPSVDVSQLLGIGGRQRHPGDRIEIRPECRQRLHAGASTVGALSGFLGGVSTVATAKLIARADEEYFCREKYQQVVPFFKSLCWSAKESSLDDFAINWVTTKQGLVTFTFLYTSYMWWESYTRLSKRFAKIRELALEPLGPALSPHLVICANGFLTGHARRFSPWEVHLDCPWTTGQVMVVRYATEALTAVGSRLESLVSRAATHAYTAVQVALVCSNPVSLVIQGFHTLVQEFDDAFDVAIKQAEQAGIELARYLQTLAGNPRRRRYVSLVGFSVGAVLVHSCLLELRRLEDAAGGLAPPVRDMVCDVVMLGAPVAGASVEEWKSIRELASGRFINGFLRLDAELINHHWRRTAGRGAQYAGCSALSAVPGIENYLLDEFLASHVQYPQQVPAILTHIMKQ